MKGEHLLLRAPEISDIDTIYKWENDPEIWHLGNTLAPYSRMQIENFVVNYSQDIYASHQLRFMIDLHSGETPVTIGSIDLYDFDPHHRRAGIGILIEAAYRRRGYAAEALEILTNYCFNTLEMNQVFCSIESTNTESIELFKKCGFTPCALKKQWLLIAGEYVDEVMMQKLRRPNS